MSQQNWENIPEELRYLSQWCIAGPDKSPYSVNGTRASVTMPTSWADWHSASIVAQQWGAGIGFVLHESDHFTCIDLDVKDEDNEPNPAKRTTPEQMALYHRIIEAFDSYTEYSKSGKGFHIWVRGKVGAGCRRDGVEVYSQQRFIICTGNVVLDRPVEARQELLEVLVADIRRASQATVIELVDVEATESDEVLWARAAGAENGDKFKELCQGNWQALNYPSQSEADLSLLSMLCFYSKSNEQVRRMFRQTGLGKRDKATKNDVYLNRTLGMIRGRQEREEVHTKQAEQDAIKLVDNVPKRNLLVVPTPSQIDWPPGILGDLAQWFYSIAPRPVKEVAIVSALGLFAGLFGRAYNINGSGLNLYIVLVARSAIGKEAIHSGISKFVHIMMNAGAVGFNEFVDFADYASGPALVKSITSRTSFVNVAGEWGRKLRKMSDDHTDGPMSSLRTVMTNLYQKSSAGTIVGGIGYSDKEKDVKSVNGVAYSMLGETTPDTFYESLTNTMMQDGFMSRFIVVEYAGLRPEANSAQGAPLPEHIYNTLLNAYGAVIACPPDGYYDVPMSREAQSMLDAFNKHCDKEINSTDDESWRQMWNRAHLKALKISGILAVADNHASPIVSEEHAEWALNLVNRDIKIMSRKILEGDVGDGDIVRERKLLSMLVSYLQDPVAESYGVKDVMRKAGVVARKYLQIRLQRVNSFAKHRLGHTAALDMTLRSLVDSGYLVEVTRDKIPAEWQFHGKCYRIVSLPESAF